MEHYRGLAVYMNFFDCKTLPCLLKQYEEGQDGSNFLTLEASFSLCMVDNSKSS